MIAAESTPQDSPAAPADKLQDGESLPLDTSLYLVRDGQDFVYFLFTQPFASHAVDDKVGRNLCLARCALFGLATHTVLAKAFALSPRTVARAKARLIQRGEGDFQPPRKPRRRHGIEDPAVLAKAAELLQAGHSLYSVAQQLAVSSSTLWSYSQAGLLPLSQCAPRRPGESDGSPAEGLFEPQADSQAGAEPAPAVVSEASTEPEVRA